MSDAIHGDEPRTAAGGKDEASPVMTRRAALAGAALVATATLPAAAVAEQQSPAAPPRGSEKLIEQLSGMKDGISHAQIHGLLKVLTGADARLIDWHIKGIPVPEIIRGSVLAPIKTAGLMVGQIYEAQLRSSIQLFPYGVPPVIDQVRIEVVLGE